ncbi:MAG: serine/threonine protein kinase [Planctomycetes bacterium]|nr:serine/threonine protein kinase [Planctomycetota bacterium]
MICSDLPLPAPGEVLGEYALFSVAGEGAAGVVYEALDAAGRSVAVKVLRPEKALDPRGVEEFRAEAEATRLVDHENVASIFDAGFVRGYHYLAMEFVGGPRLADLVARCPIEWRRATRIVIGVAEALDHAHRRGLVHRDVKPENILLHRDGRPRLTDFGIAKDISTLKGWLATGRPVGTAAYASPEQCLGKRLSPATDMYSLGATFYAMVCGRPPFTGASRSEVMRMHVKAVPRPPRDLIPDLPRPLSRLIERMMAKRVADRVPDMDRLARDLRTILAGRIPIAPSAARARA